MKAIRSLDTQQNLEKLLVINLIDNHYVLLKLQTMEDFTKAWTRDYREMEGALFRLFK